MTGPGNIIIYRPGNPPNPYFTLDDLQFWCDYFNRVHGSQVVELRCSHATRRHIIKLMNERPQFSALVINTDVSVNIRAERNDLHGRVTFVLDNQLLVPLYPARTERT